MKNEFIVGVFDDEEKLVAAATILKESGVKIHDIYTPFPVHGLDELLDISRSRLPQVTFAAGLFGLIVSIGFQVWTSAFVWPINVGGKPMLSIPAFVPVTFEIMILLGALTTVAAFFFKAKLFPSKDVELVNLRQTDDKFVLVLINDSLSVDQKKIGVTLMAYGAFDVIVPN